MSHQVLVEKYQSLQTKLGKQVSLKQTLESQLVENKAVLNELAIAKDQKIYKLVGPVLTPVEGAEAKTSVEARVEYIQGQMEGLDKVIAGIETELEAAKLKLVELQQKMQQQDGTKA